VGNSEQIVAHALCMQRSHSCERASRLAESPAYDESPGSIWFRASFPDPYEAHGAGGFTAAVEL